MARLRFAVSLPALLISLVFLNLLAASAQDLSGLEQGLKPYGSYRGGDIDSISTVNGNLTLHIPLISYPQRGGKIHFGFSVVYKNQVLQAQANCDPYNHNCTSEWYIIAQPTGIQIVPDAVLGFATVPNGTQAQYYNIVEPDGSTHKTVPVSTYPDYWMSIDTTGYRFTPNSSSSGDQTGTLVDRYGTVYSMSGWQATDIVDSNGNHMDATSNAQGNPISWTDTLGRVLPLNGTTTTDYSHCTGTQTTTGAYLWNLPGPNGGTSQFIVCSASFPINFTAPGCTGNCKPNTGNMAAIQSIVLPNYTAWTFGYDTTGVLTQITLPTGGTISYTWNFTSGACVGPQLLAEGNGVVPLWPLGRNVTTRTVNANDNTGPHQWAYALNPTYSGTSGANVQTVVTDPLGNDAVHSETAVASCNCSLYETELDQYSGSHTNGTLLKKTATLYTGNAFNFLNGSYSPYNFPLAGNVVPTSVTYTDVPSGKVSQVTKTYDPGVPVYGSQGGTPIIFGDLTTQNEYDFGNGAPGTLLRQTNNAYLAFTGQNAYNQSASNYLWNNMWSLPYTVQVKNSSAQVANTYYGYDESALQSSGITEQKRSNFAYPGNQTSVHRWLNGSTAATTNCNVSVSNGYIVSSNVYYDTGEAQQSTDPCGYPTTYQYDPAYYGAYLTKVTNALGQITTYAYDFNMGSVTSIQDPNTNAPPTTKTYDLMNRLTQVSYPDTGSTKYCYTDGVANACPGGNAGNAAFAVVETKAITSSQNEISTATLDGLARLSQTQLNSDPDGVTYVDTTYDKVGRKSTVSNPHRSGSATTDGITTYNYDALNRVKSVTEQDGSVVNTTYDQIIASNTGVVCSTVTDEAGKSRQSCVDGLGRMTSVWEDPAGLNYETDYAYDALNNLQSVTQKGNGTPRVRTFAYDSLSHLTSASNPESGNIAYAYDADGNVITKTAPLPNQTGTATVTTTNTYDKLNRVISKSYTDSYTPLVQFGYDGVALTGCTIAPPGDTDTYPVGRRTSMCDGSGGTSWTHDKTGRVTQERCSIGSASVNHYIDYTFNLDGSLRVLQTPPMKQMNYSYNGAGRATQLVDSTDSINFALNATYAPPGELAGATLGSATGFTGFTITNYYNDRLQPILLSATNSATGAAVLSDCFDFHLGVSINSAQTPPCSVAAYNPPADNGNVYQITNNRSSTRTQSFTYDSLNRILSGQSSGTGGTSWGDTYVIDAWGNLTNMNPVSGKGYGQNFQDAPASLKNQLNGYCNDAAGNLILNITCPQNPIPAYVYDAENRLVWTSGYRYIYDGDGQRVEKCTAASATAACPTSGTTGTLYWRGTGSDTLAETDLGGNDQEEYIFFNGQRIARRDTTSTGATIAIHYYFSDHLGSHGVVENATGTVCEQDIDYYPYGGVENDYCPNVSQNYKFTGKERDTESGLDNFGKRYNASNIGRWMSPDTINVTDERVVNPANTLNKYIYGGNNPLKYFDPDGKDITFFYDRGGIAGHAILFVYNQDTDTSAIESFGPKVRAPIWEGESMYEMKDFTSVDDLRHRLTALTIQTQPEVAQEVISYIREHPDPALWVCAGPNCSTQVWKILNKFKLAQKGKFDGSPGGLPKNLWQLLIHQYNPSQDWTRWKNGEDYGHPRFDMFNLLWWSLPQAEPKATVTTTETYYIDVDCTKNPGACK
jgi:RHS repeat-associated protein